MKRLKRMLLINWYFFQKEVIEFDTLTFLTGKTGSGKSTIIDALQLVLLSDTSGSFFNKSANGKSRRTLIGYLRGELTDNEAGGFTYLRNDRFTSYVVLEFYDEEKSRYFTAGCCFDVYSDNDIPHKFFGYYGAMPENLYIIDGLPLSIEKLQRWIRTEHPESTHMVTATNKEFRDYLYGKLGGLQMKFADLFKKAVPFTPISDIQTFITEFVFGHEQPVDIHAMQETIESYTQMEQEADRLQERRNLLEEISDLHGGYQRLRNQIQTNQYIADRADYDLAARETQSKKQDLARKMQRLEQDRLTLKEKQRQREALNTQYIHIKTELASSGLQQHIEELEKVQAELKRQMDIWQAEYNKRNHDFSRLTAGWKEVLRGCDALPMEQTEVLGERTKVSLETFVHQKGAAVQAVAELTGKELSEIDLPAAETADRSMRALDRGMVALQSNVDQDLREAAQAVTALVEEQKSLQAGRQRYPESVTALRQALEERLSAQAQNGASVRMVAELWDVRDQTWRNAVEGYLNTQRFNLLVAEESYQAAAAIYNSIKDTLHIHGVAVVDIAAIRRLNPERRPGSLAEEIITQDADARLYADFLLGRVMKCENLEEHNRQEISITKGCMLYQQKAIRHLNPKIWARPLLGQGARLLRLRQLEEELPQKRKTSEQLSRWIVAAKNIARPQGLGTSESEDWKTARQALARIPAARKEWAEKQAELDAIDREPLFAMQEKEQKLYRELTESDKEIGALNRSIGEQEGKCRDLETQQIPQAQANQTRLQHSLDETYPANWRQQTGEPRYQQEISTHAGLEAVSANFRRSATAARTSADKAWNSLRDARIDYNRRYQMGLDVEKPDNAAFDAVLQEIRENRLPAYLDKIRDAKDKAMEQFQEEFIGVLHTNISNAERAIRDLNYALLRTPFSEDSYAFQVKPNPEYRRFYDMLTDRMNLESYTLFAEQFRQKYAAEIEELFGILTDTSTGDIDKRVEKYTNYRTYLQFDLTVTTPDGLVQRLSRMMEKKSGGETQTPFYIAVLASFAQLYRMDRDPRGSTIRLVVFDEAFSKMDGERIAQSMKILRALHFQAILSAPPDKIGDISTLVDRNLCVMHKGHTTIVRAFDPREAAYVES